MSLRPFVGVAPRVGVRERLGIELVHDAAGLAQREAALPFSAAHSLVKIRWYASSKA